MLHLWLKVLNMEWTRFIGFDGLELRTEGVLDRLKTFMGGLKSSFLMNIVNYWL